MSLRRFDTLVRRMARSEVALSTFELILSEIEELEGVDVTDLEQLRVLGLPVAKISEKYLTLNTRLTSLEDQVFCIVDIETSGNDVENGQIIEIGALLVKNGEELDRFESLVYAKEVPDAITELTGIKQEDLQNAPSLASVLEKFRLFLKDYIFVAHNVKFDYNFINDSFIQCGFGQMLNRRLCTIDLARKTLKSERYGLEHLRESLGLEKGDLHRAFWDAYNAKEIFNKCLEDLPYELYTSEELIEFSNPNPKKRKKITDKKTSDKNSTKDKKISDKKTSRAKDDKNKRRRNRRNHKRAKENA